MYDGDDWYGDVLVPLAEGYVREAVFRAPKLDLPPDILLAAVIDVWERVRGEVVGIDDLEVARDIALRVPPAEITDEPAISDMHVHDVVEGPQVSERQPGLSGMPKTNNGPRGLFRAS